MDAGRCVMRLSVAQWRALARLKSEPGGSWNQYGPLQTLNALRSRGLISITIGGEVTLTEAGRDLHLHSFRTTMHMDGCHWYSSAGICDCGATYTHYGERDLRNDPYSAIWMDERNEAGEDVPCQRCEELKDGARPIFREHIFETEAPVA